MWSSAADDNWAGWWGGGQPRQDSIYATTTSLTYTNTDRAQLSSISQQALSITVLWNAPVCTLYHYSTSTSQWLYTSACHESPIPIINLPKSHNYKLVGGRNHPRNNRFNDGRLLGRQGTPWKHLVVTETGRLAPRTQDYSGMACTSWIFSWRISCFTPSLRRFEKYFSVINNELGYIHD